MTIHDRIYGSITINDPVIIDLVHSKPIQRLKGISQDGASHYIQPIRNVTRYEHSIGTWYLSHFFKRPIEEQIASLLHDVPHTAFSHVIDFVMNDKNHEYHDRFTKEVISSSEIPKILKRYNIDLQKVLNKERFYLLDNKLPDLSVDRWDYFMRDGNMFQLLPKKVIDLFLDNVKIKGERFFFETHSVAGLFAVMFMNCSRLIWLDPTSHGAFFLIAESLKKALNKRYITKNDFFSTDEVLMKMLRGTEDHEILSLLNRLEIGREFCYASESQAEFFGPNKPRYIDPWVEQNNKLIHLSDLVPGLRDYFCEFTSRYTNLGVRQSEKTLQ